MLRDVLLLALGILCLIAADTMLWATCDTDASCEEIDATVSFYPGGDK